MITYRCKSCGRDLTRSDEFVVHEDGTKTCRDCHGSADWLEFREGMKEMASFAQQPKRRSA